MLKFIICDKGIVTFDNGDHKDRVYSYNLVDSIGNFAGIATNNVSEVIFYIYETVNFSEEDWDLRKIKPIKKFETETNDFSELNELFENMKLEEISNIKLNLSAIFLELKNIEGISYTLVMYARSADGYQEMYGSLYKVNIEFGETTIGNKDIETFESEVIKKYER